MIGELGAIDPARVTITLPASKLPKQPKLTSEMEEERELAARKNGSSSSSSNGARNPGNAPPWELTVGEIGMSILEHHLVPELRSTALAHDRTCFAIQAILKELNRCEVPLSQQPALEAESDGSKCSRSGSNEGDEEMSGTDGQHARATRIQSSKGVLVSMSEVLRAKLSSRQLLDITEPFWVTNYTMRPLEAVIESPVYRPETSLVQWLARWARKLGEWLSS